VVTVTERHDTVFNYVMHDVLKKLRETYKDSRVDIFFFTKSLFKGSWLKRWV
jgi:hypothetical protein